MAVPRTHSQPQVSDPGWAGTVACRIAGAPRGTHKSTHPPTNNALWKKCVPGGFAHKPPQKKAAFLHTVPIFVIILLIICDN